MATFPRISANTVIDDDCELSVELVVETENETLQIGLGKVGSKNVEGFIHSLIRANTAEFKHKSETIH